MKILIDATPILPNPSGIGLYVFNLITALYALQTQENFELGLIYQPGIKNWLRGNLSFPKILEQYDNRYMLPIPVRVSDFLFLNFPKLLEIYYEKNFNTNIIHGTNYAVHPAKNSKKILNIYDLTFIKYPNYTDSVVKKYAKRVRRCLEWTDLVITISESSKNDIVEYLGVDPNLIYVTPLASRYSGNLYNDTIQPSQYHNYDFSHPYLLFVSTIEPRKNIINLITAFNLLKQGYKIDHNLVLIGQKGWQYEPIFTAIENSPWKSNIHHLNYLSDEEVAMFYLKADAFVYPSYYEGFGLPVLEAMALGTPVITANASSLPEVAGDAALLVDTKDPYILADAILKVICDRQLRQELIQKGKERAKLFSWEKTAQETLKAYKSLIA